MESGTKVDPSTGSTPRKRMWDFADEWELTKGRDALLKEWRQKGVSSKGSETFLATHLPLPDDEDEPLQAQEEEDRVMLELEVEPESPAAVEDDEMLQDELLSPSLSSSASSSATIVTPQPIPPPSKPMLRRPSTVNLKPGLHTKGTLTERSTNIALPRRRLR